MDDDLMMGTIPAKPAVRDLTVIAREIQRDWKNVWFGAAPYLSAMATLHTMRDKYGQDDARGIVNYFLGNAKVWRGETARRIKAELNSMLKGRG